MAAWTRAWVAGLIRNLSAFPLKTNDTVDRETPAVLATSEMVGLKLMLKLGIID